MAGRADRALALDLKPARRTQTPGARAGSAPEALPDPAPGPAPEPPPVGRFTVVAQLEGGSRVELDVYADLPSASHVATEAMRAVRNALSDWPLLGGRYVRPSAVVSVEVTGLL